VVLIFVNDPTVHTSDGGLILSASSLTNRTWSGSLWYFDEPDAAPDIERVKAGAEADSSISDMAVIPHNRIVTASDSGMYNFTE
jgi:methylosome protein 50